MTKGRLLLGLFCLALVFGLPHFSRSQTSSVKVFYVATAVDANGFESVNSNEASCTLTPTTPKCNLSWTASTSIVAGYNIKKSSVTGGPYTKVNTTLITGLTYVDVYPAPNPPVVLQGAPGS